MKVNPTHTNPDKHLHAIKSPTNTFPSQLVTDSTPWPNPVDGAELLSEMTDALKGLVVAPLCCLQTMSLWALYTHAFNAVQTSPILAFVSPQKRCGKTSALTALSYLVRRPLGVSNITPAALYRAIEKWHPTLLVDEAETFMTSHEELRGIINSGHRRSMARVVRSTGDKHEPKAFSTWCPKAIARIGMLDTTLSDRAFVIPLCRKRPSEMVETLGPPVIARLQVLGEQAARWAIDHQDSLPPPKFNVRGLNDRAKDNWLVLLQIATAAGEPWPRIASDASAYCAQLDEPGESEEASTMLLQDIRKFFIETGETRLPSQLVAQLLVKMEHRPWPEWRGNRPITPRQIAELLSPYKVSPKSIRLSELGTPKGYDLAQFEDAFARYLPALAATPPQLDLKFPSH